MDGETLDVRVTDENLEYVAKATGRPLEALRRHLELSVSRNEAMHVRIEKR